MKPAVPLGSRYTRYPEYKEAGVDWLAEIPSTWRLLRLRYISQLNPSKSEIALPRSVSVSFVPMEAVGEYGGLELDQQRAIDIVSEGFTYFRDGDVLVAKITPCFENGKGALAADLINGVGFGTTELHVLRATSIHAKYLFYLTLSDHFRGLGAGSMYGAGGQKRVPESFIRDLKHPLPSPAEQVAIATFLDRETQRIDALVAKKERLIQLLHERRASTITQAVTRGVRLDVPLVDSGIPWLGSVPKHWRVLRLRRLLSNIEQGWSPVADDRVARDDEWAVIRLNAVSSGRFDPSAHKALPEAVTPESRWEIQEGDFLVTRANTPELVGDVCVVDAVRGKLMLCDLVYRLTLHQERILPGFLAAWLLSRAGRHQIEIDARGSSRSMVKISQGDIREWPVLMPPLPEQRAIVDFITAKSEEVDRMILAIRTAISHLQELRTALISAAVIGKIDVRNFPA